MQLAYSIDHVSLTGRAEPLHLYSLNNLFSNHREEGKVSLCLWNEVPWARNTCKITWKLFNGAWRNEGAERKGRPGHDLLYRKRKGGGKVREVLNQKQTIVKLAVHFVRLIGMRNKLFIALLLFKHCSLLKLEGEMLTSLTCPCEIKKCSGKSNESMNIKKILNLKNLFVFKDLFFTLDE